MDDSNKKYLFLSMSHWTYFNSVMMLAANSMTFHEETQSHTNTCPGKDFDWIHPLDWHQHLAYGLLLRLLPSWSLLGVIFQDLHTVPSTWGFHLVPHLIFGISACFVNRPCMDHFVAYFQCLIYLII